MGPGTGPEVLVSTGTGVAYYLVLSTSTRLVLGGSRRLLAELFRDELHPSSRQIKPKVTYHEPIRTQSSGVSSKFGGRVPPEYLALKQLAGTISSSFLLVETVETYHGLLNDPRTTSADYFSPDDVKPTPFQGTRPR